MNVFEDLIEELRDENLLEATVIDQSKGRNGSELTVTEAPGAETSAGAADDARDGFQDPEPDSDFYRKRAMDEVSSLQMVEHVIAGIEREHMKTVPASYDDLEAKKALHRFLQIQGDPGSAEYTEAEFRLMQETEAWNTALCKRDRDISVSNLRRFCENSRPALSSQALLALGRFYRNSAFSELSRAKFDLVMTRLFSRDTGDDRRRLLFDNEDAVGHLKTLYANWSSVVLYSGDEASLRMRAVLAGFRERTAEAEEARTFRELVENDFFAKTQEFKEATGELFFTPEIIAASIECNVRIGNRFIDLIEAERGGEVPETVEQRYGYEYDQIVSEAAGKTFHLVELLKGMRSTAPVEDAVSAIPAAVPRAHKKEKARGEGHDLFRVNKWLLITTILIVAASSALFLWSNQENNESAGMQQARGINLEAAGLGEHLRSGRATTETLYAITLPSWDQLSDEQKREIAKKALDAAFQNKLKRVKLVNARGDAVAFAADTRVDIYAPTP